MGKTRPKDIGTRQETAIKNVLNDFAGKVVCERVALHGSKDHGDLRIVVDDLVLTGESKHCKSYPSEGMLDSFKRQTVAENENAMQDGGLLFVNNTGKSINRMDVWMQKSTYLKLHGADKLLEREDLTDGVRRNIEGLLADGEFDWLRLTLLAFMYLCWGKPAWGIGD